MIRKRKTSNLRNLRGTYGRSSPILERTLFAQLFEATGDGHLLIDTNGSIVLANRRAAEMFGYPRNLLIGRPCEMLFSQAHQARLREQIDALAGFQETQSERPNAPIELQAQRRDGTSFPAEVSLNPLPAGQGLRAVCVVRDNTQRNERERRLRKQSEMVQFLQDVAVAANEANSVNAALQYTVNRLAKLLGWPVGHAYIAAENDTLVPTSIWSAEKLPERFMVFKAVSEALRFKAGEGLIGWVLKSGKPIWLIDLENQERFARKNEARTAGLRTGLILPVIAGKRVVGVLEFYSPETIPPDPSLTAVLPHAGVQIGRVIERKQAEDRLNQQTAQLKLVMMNLPVVIWMIDRTGRLLLLEGKGLQETNMVQQKLVGKDLFTELETRPDLLGLFRRALDGEEVHSEVSSRTGTIFDSYFMPYYDKDWNVDGIVGLSIDITRRKELEGELEEMKNRLIESADIERARLAQQLHDGPLQDLYGAFYQIQDAKTRWEQPQQKTAEQTLQTIQNVNATLRMICGELHPTTLVHLGLQRAIRGHAERMQERLNGTTIHLDLEDDSPSAGSTIPAQMRLGLFRIYQQLINNAARHAKAQHIWVRLRIKPEQVTLEVQDNGKGFKPPEHWIALVRQNQYGLVSALQRAQAMGGQMEVRSQPGAGALVRVRLPRETQPAG